MIARAINLLLISIAYAKEKDGHLVPITDNLMWWSHLSQDQLWMFAQMFIFCTWLGSRIWDYFKDDKDKTSQKLDMIVEQQQRQREASSLIMEEIRNIKYNMLSKDEAHNLIEKKIEFANKLRSQQ